jgi:predicted dehydrogenase
MAEMGEECGPLPVLRGALIGFGGVAEHGHLPGLLCDPRFEICAVVDPEPMALERAANALGDGIRLYSSPAECLASERLDFLDIATPPSEHLEAIELAAGAGLHLLVEKPLALNLEEALRAGRAARQGAVALTVVHNWHHAPHFRAAREALEEGAIGTPEEAEFVTERTEPAGGGAQSWRLDAKISGGGILVDHGWHQLYLARALLGGPDPRSVRAVTERRRWKVYSVEDTAEVRVRYRSGARAILRLTWAARRRRTLVTIRGESGILRVEDGGVVVAARGELDKPWPSEPDAPDDSYHASWFPGVLDAFAEAVRKPSSAAAAAHQREALLCQAVIDAAYRSADRPGAEIAVEV